MLRLKVEVFYEPSHVDACTVLVEVPVIAEILVTRNASRVVVHGEPRDVANVER